MPADMRSLHGRLDQLGSLQGGEGVPMDEGGAFAHAVRARARRRVIVRSLSIGGASLAAATLLVVAALALRGAPPAHDTQPGIAVAATGQDRPTMAWLSRVAAETGKLPEIPGGDVGQIDGPIRSGAVFSSNLTSRILSGR